MSKQAISTEIIQNKIYLVRGFKVMFDRDLAVLYGVLTKNLNKAVNRNIDRFPEDFMFRLTKDEMNALRFQFGTSKEAESSRFQFGTLNRGQNIKYLPFVFTEQGVAMLSSVLKSKRAVQVNIQIMRVFTKLREMLISHKDLARKIEDLERKFGDHNQKIIQIFEALRRLMTIPSTSKDSLPNPYKRTKVGFIVDKESARKGTHAH